LLKALISSALMAARYAFASNKKAESEDPAVNKTTF